MGATGTLGGHCGANPSEEVRRRRRQLSRRADDAARIDDRFEKAAPAHDWWDWYAAYLSAREQGSSPDEADAAADRYMAEAKGVVVTSG